MRIKLIVVGKTTEKYLQQGIEEYSRRIKHYVNFDIIQLPEVKFNKKISLETVKQKEARLILDAIDCPNVVLLDEQGKQMSSVEFAQWLQDYFNQGIKCLTFVVGGAYGFPEDLKTKFPKISLSPMTFSHQLVRLVFVEQLYRAFTIINSQPYHH